MQPPRAPTDDTPPMLLPPWMGAGTPRETLREAFARATWVLASYWALLVGGYLALVAVAVVYWRADRAAVAIPLLVVASGAGVALGNLLALLRTRSWVIQLVVCGAIAVGCVASMQLGVPVVLFVMTFLTSVGSGHTSLQRGGTLWSLFVPMVCWAGAILTVVEKHGRLRSWEAGAKAAIWEPATLVMLLLVVTLYFLYMAGQEHYHTQVWQAAATQGPVSLVQHRASGAMRFTKRGMAAIAVLAVVVGTAVSQVSPYLFRTETRRGDDHGERGHAHEPEPGDPLSEPSPGSRFDWDALGRAMRRAAREAEEGSRDALPFVPLFLLNRPLRRWWVLRRLRRPLRPESPSRRAENLWRYVRVALDDTGRSQRPGETVEDVSQRIDVTRARVGLGPAASLRRASDGYQQIRYGLGIPEGAVSALERDAEGAFDEVRASLTGWQRVKSWWRRIDL